MYKEFGVNRDKFKAAQEIVMSLLMIMALVFLVIVLIGDAEYGTGLFLLLVSILMGVFLVDRVKMSYEFYPLVRSEKHLITHLMMGNRKVYDIDKITRLWIIKDRVIWLHSGWPAVVYVKGLSIDEKAELRQMIQGKTNG